MNYMKIYLINKKLAGLVARDVRMTPEAVQRQCKVATFDCNAESVLSCGWLHQSSKLDLRRVFRTLNNIKQKGNFITFA